MHQMNHAFALTNKQVAGDYCIYVYPVSSHMGSMYGDSVAFTLSQGEGDDEDDDDDVVITPPSTWMPFIPWVAFGTLLGIGTLICYHTGSGIAFPCILFGGMMMMSIPGTMLCYFPPVVLFLSGLVLVLMLVLMFRR